MTELRVAARNVNITPATPEGRTLQGYGNVLCTGKVGDVWARVLVLQTGDIRAVIVSADAAFAHETPFWMKCLYSSVLSGCVADIAPTFAPGTREEWSVAAGYPGDPNAERVFVSATHAHTAPAVDATATTEITKAIKEAVAEVGGSEPVTISVHTKRRPDWMDAAFGMPGLARLRRPTLTPQSEPCYDIDDTMTLVKFSRSPQGPPVAVLVNYGVHPTLWGTQELMSPDFTGEAMVEVRHRLGPSVVPIFLQGCCGDVSPVWPEGDAKVERKRYDRVQEWAGYLANHVVGGLDHCVPLEPALVRSAVERWKPTLRPMYGTKKDPPPPHPEVVVSGIRLAKDAAVIGVSGELFSGYRCQVASWAKPAGIRHVLVGSIVNGYSGYLPQAIDFKVSDDNPHHMGCEGEEAGYGYETSVTPYTAEIEEGIGVRVRKVLGRILE